MKTNLDNAKAALIHEMQTDENWRNYYNDTIDALIHEHSLCDTDAPALFETMQSELKK